jgi:lysophospholipase-3
VPGLGGSQLEARLVNKAKKRSLLCRTGTRAWFALWLNLEPFVTPGRFECWTDNARLEWDFAAHAPRSPSGVEVRVARWNSTQSVERVDANAARLDWLQAQKVLSLPPDLEEVLGWLNPLKTMVHRLVDELGYTRGVDLFAAPYDFRQSPHANQQWGVAMKSLIETTVANNGGRPVTVVCHSMGGLYTIALLNRLEENWVRFLDEPHVLLLLFYFSLTPVFAR